MTTETQKYRENTEPPTHPITQRRKDAEAQRERRSLGRDTAMRTRGWSGGPVQRSPAVVRRPAPRRTEESRVNYPRLCASALKPVWVGGLCVFAPLRRCVEFVRSGVAEDLQCVVAVPERIRLALIDRAATTSAAAKGRSDRRTGLADVQA